MKHPIDQEVVAGFISEAKGYLPEIMLGLEAFAAAPEQQENIQEAFRYAHIIKGAASMLGFKAISELAYELEVQLEKLCEQQMTLTSEKLEDLCQNVNSLANLLDTALEDPASTALPLPDQPHKLSPPSTTTALGNTDFDFSFTSLYKDKPEETGKTQLLEAPKSVIKKMPAASVPEEEMSSILGTDFSVSLPATADTTTVGELNLSQVAAELKESFGNTLPPPQPEFLLPNELMSALPDFQFQPFTPATTDETELLEVAENYPLDISYDNLADDLATNLLSELPTPLPEPGFSAPAPTFPLPAPMLMTEAFPAKDSSELLELRALPDLTAWPEPTFLASEPTLVEETQPVEEEPGIPALLPLPELPELLAYAEPEIESFPAEPVSEISPEVSPYQFDDFLPAAPIVETPTTATSPPPLDLPEELLEVFLLEAEEHLQIMQTALRALEKRPSALESLQGLRRSAHSLKGTAALVGFRNIMQLAHRMEDLLDLVYEEKFVLTSEATQLLMRATDLLEDMSTGQIDEAALQNVYAEFDLMLAEGGALPEPAASSPSVWAEEPLSEPELPAEIIAELTIFDPPPVVVEQTFPLVAEEFAAADLALPDLAEELEPQEIILDEAILPDEIALSDEPMEEESGGGATVFDHPTFPSFASELPAEPVTELETAPEVAIEVARQRTETGAEEEAKEAIETATEMTLIERPTEESQATLTAPVFPASLPISEVATPFLVTEPAELATTTANQEELSTSAQPDPLPPAANPFLRVSIDRLDEVVKLIGEMIITRTAFEQRLADFAHQVEELQIAGSRLRRASTDLESKYEASTLGGGKGSWLPGKLPVERSANALVTHHTHGFDDLEFDRYTEFHLVSRELVESSSDIQTVGREFGHLNSDFLGYLNRQSRIYNELQDRLMRLRMVPLASIGQRLHRTVRQVSTHENKLVELILEGEATAIDTLALQDLVDPLVHLLRNAVDHGIESPEARTAQGKPATGRITLRAFYEGSQVILQLSDDGKGLDNEKIRAKALQYRLLSQVEAESLSPAELWSLIFTPGFSTASQVSEISGRGIGLDVVQNTVQKLKGTITIDSRPQAGVTFTIRLPLTLAVTRALMVKAHDQHFAVPLDVVTQIMRLDMNKVERLGKEPIIRIGGKIYPLLMLSRLLNLRQNSDDLAPRPPALLINVEGKEVVVIVDQLLGGREVLVKSLGTHLRNVHGVMGATLMGNGEVVLILNLAELLRGTTRTTLRRQAIIAPSIAAPMGEPIGARITSAAEVASASSRLAIPPTSRLKPEAPPLTIMIVDDSPSVRRAGANLIKNIGWIPVQAKDGLEALEKLQTGEVRPDLIMLDIEMPRMDGYQLLNSLRALSSFRQLPIVIVSSRSSEKHRQKAFDLGATEYLVKPYQEDYVVSLIRRLVKNDNS